VPERDSRKIGLARSLSKLGHCSRSQACELIRSGRVSLNGAACRNIESPTRIGRDHIAVDGRSVQPAANIYQMMNKPRGLITSASDEKGRETVYSILKGGKAHPWMAPVGRLDKASEGLLFLTNDSEWAARISAPESHVPKTYHVQINAIPTEGLLNAIERGVKSEDGVLLRASQCRLLRSGEKNSWLEITLDEGKNRQIRRMLAGVHCEVLRLVRVAIGPIQLGDLAKGAYRPLSGEEKNALDRLIDRSG